MNKDKKSREVVVFSVRPEGRTTTINTLLHEIALMQIQVLSIHRGHELLWDAQQILLETCRKQISAKLRTADIFIFLMIISSTVLKTCA